MIAFASPIIAYVMISMTAPRWRTVYWFLFAWECLGLVLLAVFYWPPTFSSKHGRDGKTPLQLLSQLDFVGVFLFASGCSLFLVGVNWVGPRQIQESLVLIQIQGGRRYAWSSAHVIANIVIGLLLLVVLGFWEAYANLTYPMLPPKLFSKVRSFTMILVVAFVGGVSRCYSCTPGSC